MVEDLIFRQPPPGGPPNILIFGEPDAPSSGGAVARGSIPLPTFMLAGQVSATPPPRAHASGAIPLPVFMLAGVARYDSATHRPLVGKVSSGWQVAAPASAAVMARHQVAERGSVGRVSRWQRAEVKAGVAASVWQDSGRARNTVTVRHQAAGSLSASTAVRWQEAGRARNAARSTWQAARQLAPTPLSVRYQEANRLRRAVHSGWQEAGSLVRRHGEGFGAAQLVERGWIARWQSAMAPMPGRSVIVPPEVDPCYLPDTLLVFREKQKYSTKLVFICERHGTTPPGQAPLVIPFLRVYMTTHHLEAVLLPTLERVPLEDVAIEAAAGMPHWKLTATGPLGLMDFFPINSPPRLVRVTVDGMPWVFAVSAPGRSRIPGQRRARIVGRSVTALAGASNIADRTWLNNAPATAQQVVIEALQSTGISVDWQIPDWLLPAGTWSFQGKPLAAAVRVAEAVGAVLQSHPTEPTLQFLPRYKSLPWEWDESWVTPDVSIASAAIAADDYEIDEQPQWEAVYVFGAAQGVGRRIVRDGSAGIILAPQVVDGLITDHVAAVERGRSILGAGGTQALVSVSLPILTGGTLPGVLRVNQLKETVEPSETWRGMVRGVSLRAGPEEVRQAVQVERHFA